MLIERRRIEAFFIGQGFWWVEHRYVRVQKRQDGTEFIVMKSRNGGQVRVELDTPTEVFITGESSSSSDPDFSNMVRK